MRALALSLGVLATGWLASSPAHADFLLGLTTHSGLTGVNMEWTGAPGSAYVVLGAYPADTGYEFDNLTGVIGFRRFQDGKYDQNGYFGGAYVGDVDGGPGYTRLGAGGELGYQWLTAHLRMTLQAGIALAGDYSGDGAPQAAEVEPVPLIGASISLRF